MRSCSCRRTVVSESGIIRSRSNLSKTASVIGSIFCLVGLIFFLGCESKEKQNSGSRSATASVTATAVPNPVTLPADTVRRPPEQARLQSADEIRQEYRDRSRQATEEMVAALEQAKENNARATEQFEHEWWATVDKYRSMTPAERAQIPFKEPEADRRRLLCGVTASPASLCRSYGEGKAGIWRGDGVITTR